MPPGLTVVVVHGPFANGRSLDRLVSLVRVKGLRVVAAHCPSISFSGDVTAIERIIAAQDDPVLLVGHSWDGAVITEAGNHPRARGIVYIAAAPGESSNHIMGLGEHSASEIPPGVTPDDVEFMYGLQDPFVPTGDDEAADTAWTWSGKPSWFLSGEPEDDSTMSRQPAQAPFPADLDEIAEVIAQAAAELSA